ncbi:MAG TPA: IclR family transcriptional regulator [Bacillales bacterium]|nr:IclR family transcriptional regulator [Bacillales bacterium]
MDSENVVKSVDRALQIVKLISANKNMGVTEIAHEIDINKSAVYRILSTLVKHGFIEKNPETNRYQLGYTFLGIASNLLESIDLRTEAQPFLKELEALTNEVIHLVVYDQGEVVYIEKLEGNETLRMHSQVGRRAPMHCTGVGKAILAYLPRQMVSNILDQKGMPAHTAKTITEKEAFFRELEKVKHQGFALDLEENEQGITCIAAPIFNHQKEIAAAISISGPTLRMTDQRLEQLKEKITAVGREISQRLGCPSP